MWYIHCRSSRIKWDQNSQKVRSPKNSPSGRKELFFQSCYLIANGKDQNILQKWTAPAHGNLFFNCPKKRGYKKNTINKWTNKCLNGNHQLLNGRKMKHPDKNPGATEDPPEWKESTGLFLYWDYYLYPWEEVHLEIKNPKKIGLC